MTNLNKHIYDKKVENAIVNGILGGVSINDILASIQHYQNAPRNTTTLYKHYGNVIAKTRADLNGRVGKKVIEQALQGDFKSQELFLRSKAGWSPQSTELNVQADEDSDTSALDTLMKLLGK